MSSAAARQTTRRATAMPTGRAEVRRATVMAALVTHAREEGNATDTDGGGTGPRRAREHEDERTPVGADRRGAGDGEARGCGRQPSGRWPSAEPVGVRTRHRMADPGSVRITVFANFTGFLGTPAEQPGTRVPWTPESQCEAKGKSLS